ncbi:hypothetical protein ACHAXS_009979 [Conticribra weissflogii]
MMNSQTISSLSSSTNFPANAYAIGAATAMVVNESATKPHKRQREEHHFENKAEKSQQNDLLNNERPRPHVIQQDYGSIDGRNSFECDSSSSDSSFQLMNNEKLQSLQAEAGVLHSNIGAALHRYIAANQGNSGSSSDASDSAEKFLETCLNHYKQAVKFHTLALSTHSRDASLREMQQTQDHVIEMHAKLSWVRSTLSPSSATSSDSRYSSFEPSANGQILHFFADILSMDCSCQGGGIPHLLFLALFNMSTLYYTHYIQNKEKNYDDVKEDNFANEQRVNQLTINGAAQMSYLLLSKALSLLQSIDEKRENSNEFNFSFGALESSVYAIMIQNNMAVLLSDVYGRHDEALEALEEVVFWITGEDNIDDNDFAYAANSTEEVDNILSNGAISTSESDIGFSVGESCRRVSVFDDDSFDSLAPFARSHSHRTSFLRKQRKAVLLLNCSRIHYRCGLFQDAAELYRHYTLLKFPVISCSRLCNYVDDCVSVEGHEGIGDVDGRTHIERFGGLQDFDSCSQEKSTGIEKFISDCIAAAAA